MEVIKTIVSKTCYFVVKTAFEKNYLAQESGSGRSGHLMRWTPPNETTFNDYYKFIIYPDPDSKGAYRIIVVGWPDYHVVLESDRARIDPKKDTDLQRFNFQIAKRPLIEKDSAAEWNFLYGLGVNLHVDFASHAYVFPTNSSRDEAKLKFIPIDIVEPNPAKVQKVIKLSSEDQAPPKDNVDTNGKEWGIKTVSIEALPAALIDDSDYNTKSAQLSESPYYYLKHEVLWSSNHLPSVTLTNVSETVYEKRYTTAFKKTDMESVKKTIGHTFDATIEIKGSRSAEAGDDEGKIKNEVGASLKLAYQYKNQTETLSQSGTTQEGGTYESVKTTYSKLDSGQEDIILKHWVQLDRFTLTNSKGVVKDSWDYVYPKSVRLQRLKP